MGTRCNVVVKLSPESQVILYRHWDGYPAVTGADLVTIARRTIETADPYSLGTHLLKALIAETRGGEGRDADKPQYELTDSIHGDVEHVYTFTPWHPWGETVPEKNCSVEWRERSGWGEEAVWTVRTYPDLDSFVRRCINPELSAFRSRLAKVGQLDEESTAAYADLPVPPLAAGEA